MLFQRALGLFRRIRFPSQLAATGRHFAADSSTSLSLPTQFCNQFSSGLSTRRKHHWDLLLGIVLAGQTAIFLGSNRNIVFAEDASIAESVTDNDQGQASIAGLRRIEDGSVISNTHTSKWRIFTDIGRDLFQKGKLDEAEKYFLAALHEAKEGFGVRDPHVAAACNNLAELYRVRKEFEKAEPLYLEAINILEESYGPNDIRVAAALHNLGQFYVVQRKLEQARTCYERGLKIKGRVLGDGHPDYANTMYHLGTVLHLQGKEKDAEALIRESIRILEEVGEGESATCLRRMRYLSQMLISSNRLAEAEKLQRKILHILELSKGWESLDTIIAAESLALTLQALGSLTEARELLERCLEVRRNIFPHDHVQMAADMLHLARIALLISNHLKKVNVSEARRELDKAKLLVDKSIRITKELLDSPEKNQGSLQNSRAPTEGWKDRHAALIILLQSLDTIGLLEVKKNELQEAKEARAYPFEAELALRECISIFKKPEIQSLLRNFPDVKAEYLSCLKHLTILLNENIDNERQQSRTLQELKDEVKLIEAELSPSRKHRS